MTDNLVYHLTRDHLCKMTNSRGTEELTDLSDSEVATLHDLAHEEDKF